MSTTYHVVETQDDLAICEHMAGAMHHPEVLCFPTILARRDGEAIGMLGTHVLDGHIIAGPLIVCGLDRPGFVSWKLFATYNAVMRAAHQSQYLIAVEAENAPMARTLQKLGLAPYAQDAEGNSWYRRSLP